MRSVRGVATYMQHIIHTPFLLGEEVSCWISLLSKVPMLIGDEYILCDKVGKSYEDKKKETKQEPKKRSSAFWNK